MTRLPSTRRRVLLSAAAIAAGAAGFGAYHWLQRREAALSRADLLYGLQLPDLNGKLQAFSQWRQQLLLVNFWATWCEPCREEVPALVRLHEKSRRNSLQMVGISLDTAVNIRDFASKYQISYPLVIGGLESIELLRTLGNRSGALPFTVLVGPGGDPLGTHLGGMNDQSLDQFLRAHRN